MAFHGLFSLDWTAGVAGNINFSRRLYEHENIYLTFFSIVESEMLQVVKTLLTNGLATQKFGVSRQSHHSLMTMV